MINVMYKASKEARNIEHITNDLYNLSNYKHNIEDEYNNYDYNEEGLVNTLRIGFKNMISGNNRHFTSVDGGARLIKTESKQSLFDITSGDKEHSNVMLKHLKTNRNTFNDRVSGTAESLLNKRKKIDKEFISAMNANAKEGKARIDYLQNRINQYAANDAKAYESNIAGLKKELELAVRYFTERENKIKEAYKLKQNAFNEKFIGFDKNLKQEKSENRGETIKHLATIHRNKIDGAIVIGGVGAGGYAVYKANRPKDQVQSDIASNGINDEYDTY